MEIFISLVVFGVSLYLFILTNYKIRTIRENILIDDVKKEMEALLTEFNGAAARNIELMEDKIGEMQNVLQKANSKIVQLSEHLDRAARPIIVEKVVSRADTAQDVKTNRDSPDRAAARIEKPARKVRQTEPESTAVSSPQPDRTPESLPETAVFMNENTPAAVETPASRSEKLKSLVRSGKTRDELLALGYLDNEINLVHFLVGKK